jgi:hypothetical protein
MSEQIPKLLTFEEFLSCYHVKDLGLTKVGWSDILGEGWVNESDEKNYEAYKKYYLARFTKLGKYLQT